ncbi:MAG: Holliday junction branch migration protein RuvA [bacterium]
MFHIFTGKRLQIGKQTYLQNSSFGIQINYLGYKPEGDFFLYPYLDDNKKTIVYYAFDMPEQKDLFESLLKVSGIGPKTAMQIVQLPKDEFHQALKNVDVKFFQAIPGIGPKSAKKILLELKGSINVDDFEKINIDEKLFKDIVKSLKNFGYDSTRVKEILQKYE